MTKSRHVPAVSGLGVRKRRVYLVITALMLILMAVGAASLLHNSAEKRTIEYTRKARESFSEEDYEGALLYLRLIKSPDRDVLMLMADCYEAMENYPKALEVLRKMNTADPLVANRVQSIEQKRMQSSRSEEVLVAGVSLPRETRNAVLDDRGITDTELQEVVSLYALDSLSIQNNNITDITPLTALGGLDELNLAGNQIRDLTPLASLRGLRTLNLDRNPITDVSALAGLTNLNSLSLVGTLLGEEALRSIAEKLPLCTVRYELDGVKGIFLGANSFRLDATELTLSGREIEDISALRDFTELKVLNLSNNQIGDLRPLMDLAKLEKLDISGNYVSDLRPLIGLPMLTKLNASRNMITETTAVGSVSRLDELDLSENGIRDFSGLEKLSRLRVLNLRNTGVTDSVLSGFSSLRSLRNLDLQGNMGLSDKAVSALKSALPACVITTSELVYEIKFAGHMVRSDEKKLLFPSAGITMLNGLERLSKLEELDLSGNEIVSVYQFEISPSRNTLRRVNLANNQIRDVFSLSAMTVIEELDLSGNQIEALAGLKRLTTLRYLKLTGNPIQPVILQDLKAALPECEIVFDTDY